MKHLLQIVFAVLSASGPLQAQGLRVEKDSLAQVWARARQQNKPVLVLLAPPPPPANLPPALRKSRTESGLMAPAVVAALNKDFLIKELAFGSAESAAVVRQYTVSQWPTYLYFDPDGSLLYRSAGNAPLPQRYLNDLRAVREAQASPQNLSYFQTAFRQGNRSVDFLKGYIGKRRQLGQLVEPALLDAYVQQLPVHALDRAAEVVFILENGPVVGSRAQQLTRLNQKLYDSLYKALPAARRFAINDAIITNTLAQAITANDRNLAALGADFARRTWDNNFLLGSAAYERNMLRFYGATKDTTSFLRAAISFYERKYMAVSADSARKAVAALQAFRQEQAATIRRLANAKKGAGPAGSGVTTVRPVAVGGAPLSFLQELNNGAWAVYQTGTRNGLYLWRAVQWSKRTVDLDPAAYNYDTLAHLLYRLRFYSEAEAMQRQALAAARGEGAAAAGYERELEKIKKRTR